MERDRPTWLDRIFYPFFCAVILFILTVTKLPYLFIERLWPDEALYGWYANQIFADPFFIFSGELVYPPLFPVLLAAGKWFLTGDAGLRFVMLVLGAAGVFLMYVLGKKAGSPFLGAVCALMLAFNKIYYFTGTSILIDAPLAAGFILLGLALMNVDSRSGLRSDILAGAAVAVIVLLKWSSVLAFPIIAAYYLLGLGGTPWRKRLSRVLVPLGIGVFVLGLLLVKNHFFSGRMIPSTSALDGAYFAKPPWYYFGKIPVLLEWSSISFFMIGLFAVFRKDRRTAVLLLSWLLVFWVVMPFVGEKDTRYILPAVPCMILIAGIGMEAVVRLFSRIGFPKGAGQVLILGMVGFFMFVNYGEIVRVGHRSTHSYTGFPEAGAWLKRHVPLGAVVFAGSERAIRYHSGLDYRGSGGPLESTPETWEEFAGRVHSAGGPVFLEVDTWEFTQPDWIFPFEETKAEKLSALGFELVKIVVRPAFSEEKLGIYQILWIYRRP